MPLKAVLWDMDGTLVDTEPYWFECEFEMAARYDAPWTEEHALNLVGLDLLDAAAYAKKHMGIEDLEPWQIRDEILEMVVTKLQGELPWRPGAMELLKEIKAAQIPTALVTMSYSSFVDPIIAAMPSGSFDVVVASLTQIPICRPCRCWTCGLKTRLPLRIPLQVVLPQPLLAVKSWPSHIVFPWTPSRASTSSARSRP